MYFRLFTSCLLILSVAVATAAEPVHGGKRPLSVEDLYLFDAPQSVTLAPDESYAVYVRQWVDRDSKQERMSLWRSGQKGTPPRPLEEGEPDARSPVFSPDGRWVAVRSTRPRPEGWTQTPSVPPESDAATDIWLIPIEGGTAVPLAGPKKPYGRVFNDPFYGRVAFSPDGRKLAFVADDGFDPPSLEGPESDVVVVEPDQGEGYTGYGPAQIWVADLATEPGQQLAEQITRLTDDDIWYGDPQWSADGTWLVVHANRTSDRESVRFSINKNFDVWALNVADRSLRQLTEGAGPDISPRFSPDGKELAFLRSPRKGPHADIYDLVVVDFRPESQGSKPTERIAASFHDRLEYVPGDQPPAFPLPDDCWDGPTRLIYSAPQGVETVTMRLDLDGGERSELVAAGTATASSESAFERRVARRRELTPAGNGFLSERALGASRAYHWTDEDGGPLEGVLTVPHASVARPPYKLVLFPHGGPHSRSTTTFNFTAEIFAAQGYAVFQPNFRGSAGYGRRFLDADRGDFGGGDMRDILRGIDQLVADDVVDPQRQFVYGISYGGYMTCWLVGHTGQFRAAVAQNAVTDLNMMWGLSDIQSWTEWEFGGRPWEIAEAMRRHSPLTYVADVETPTLILHARDDRRCPLAMGRMFHQSLRARGVRTRMVIYPNEGHGIRQPRHR